MTEAEFKTFKHHVEYELNHSSNQKSLQSLYNKIEWAENVEEIQVIVLDVLRELEGMKSNLKEYFESKEIKFLEPKVEK